MKSWTRFRRAFPPPIQHVLYIVKENRTYDQVLGDIGKGESDPSLCLFKEKVGPNHHKLAREFVLFDNFYVNSDVSADGHNWSTSAIANDFVEKMWPSNYAGRSKVYGFEGGEPAAYPPAGFLWTNAAGARRFDAQLRLLGREQEKPRRRMACRSRKCAIRCWRKSRT